MDDRFSKWFFYCTILIFYVHHLKNPFAEINKINLLLYLVFNSFFPKFPTSYHLKISLQNKNAGYKMRKWGNWHGIKQHFISLALKKTVLKKVLKKVKLLSKINFQQKYLCQHQSSAKVLEFYGNKWVTTLLRFPYFRNLSVYSLK